MFLATVLDDATRRGFDVSAGGPIVAAVALFLTIVCVLLHYEVMKGAARTLPRLRIPRRARIVALILATFVAHVVEVWIFALAYYCLDMWPELGQIGGPFDEGALDFVYYSATVYTTLGFGDFTPTGAIRILTGTEAILGLGLITWSASLAFLEMQRDWPEYCGTDETQGN